MNFKNRLLALFVAVSLPKFGLAATDISEIDSSYIVVANVECSYNSDILIIPTNNGFGIWPIRVAGGVFKYYSLTGQLLWTFSPVTDHRQGIYKANVSANGNIFAFSYFTISGGGDRLLNCEVLTNTGIKLSRFVIIGDEPLRCSPNGSFLFNSPSFEESYYLEVYSQKGDLLISKDDPDWLAEALTDSILFYTDKDSLFLINVFSGQTIIARPASILTPSPRDYIYATCSPKGNAIALWTDFKEENHITILNKNMQLQGSIIGDRLIQSLIFSTDADLLAYEIYLVGTGKLTIKITDYSGQEANSIDLPIPNNEPLLPFPGYLQFSADYLISVRYFSNNPYKNRSFLMSLSENGRAINRLSCIDSWTYYRPESKSIITFKQVNENAVKQRITVWEARQ